MSQGRVPNVHEDRDDLTKTERLEQDLARQEVQTEELQAKLDTTEKVLKSLTADLQRAEVTLAKRSEMNVDLEEQLRVANRNHGIAIAEVEQLKEEMTELTGCNREAQAIQHQLEREIGESHNSIATLTSDLAGHQDVAYSYAESKAKEVVGLRYELKENKKYTEELKGRMETAATESLDLSVALAERDAECEQLKQTITTLEDDLKMERLTQEHMRKDLRNLSEIAKKHDQLEEEVSKLRQGGGMSHGSVDVEADDEQDARVKNTGMQRPSIDNMTKGIFAAGKANAFKGAMRKRLQR